jgi:hypothetical protein
MLPFGHLGLTVAGVEQADPQLDLRPPMLIALLPDLIDKPLYKLAPQLVNGSSRSFGHTALGAAAALAALWAWRKRKGEALLLWCCWLGHLLLDRMWFAHDPQVLFWPFLGPFPPPQEGGFIESRLGAYNLTGEALGLALLLYFAWSGGLHRRRRLSRFLRTGRLERSNGAAG